MNEIQNALSLFDVNEMDDLALNEVLLALADKLTETKAEIIYRAAMTSWRPKNKGLCKRRR